MRSIGSACLRSTGNLESSPSEDHPRKDPEPSTLELPWMMACTTGIAFPRTEKDIIVLMIYQVEKMKRNQSSN